MVSAAPRTAARPGRPRWWTELPLLTAVYAAYSAGRLLARGDVTAATGHGTALLRVERILHLTPEPALNRLFTGVPVVGVPAAYAYAALHYVVTPAVLVWLWRRRPAHYRVARSRLLTATLIGLIGFTLFPTAPPRLLDAGQGFVDGMAHYAGYGWWGAEASAPRGLGGLTNQYAAMPSLHVGWALWCGAAVWRLASSRMARALAVAYPPAIALVVMGTANHYLLDVLAGVAVMGLGAWLTGPLLRLVDTLRARGTDPGAAPEPDGPARGTPGAAWRRRTRRGRAAAARRARAGGVVGAGCETSPGERFPRQPTRGGRCPERTADAAPEPAAAPH
ncbi:phosphatase PAP2 family protein [Streptomyces sp. NBC_01525]|uniref:phosphatase PAP2 family protein n=1 Tax=Streptomyces sp. NBC_01525 TaxID=2903893 RepID=UPI00386BA5E4